MNKGGQQRHQTTSSIITAQTKQLTILFLYYLQQSLFSGQVETIPYSQFKQSIANETMGKVVIGPSTITGTLKGSSGGAIRTIRVEDPGLAKELDERKISYSGRYENKFFNSLLFWMLRIDSPTRC